MFNTTQSNMSNKTDLSSLDISPYFDVLVHNQDILVIQTHAHNIADVGTDSIDSINSFGSFNLGLHVNDDSKLVLANRALLLSMLNQYLMQTQKQCENGIDTDEQDFSTRSLVKSIYWLDQIHSNHVLEIKATETKESCHIDKKSDNGQKLSLTPPSADALFTSEPNTALAIMTADCVPIVLFNKKTGQIAAIHAGWQGLANGVIANTCQKLVTSLNLKNNQPCKNITHSETHALQACDETKPLASVDTQAWIGACISQPCYEVSMEVVEKLLLGCQKMGMDIDVIKNEIIAVHDNPNKTWLDLPKLAALQLQQHGVFVNKNFTNNSGSDSKLSENQLHKQGVAYACSYSNAKYYSYRRMTHKGMKNTGRMATVVVRLRG